MGFEQEMNKADEKIKRDYLNLVVNTYKPLFLKLSEKAVAHMRAENISQLDILPETRANVGVTFKQDGQFYYQNNKPIELIGIIDIWESAIIAKYNYKPSVHTSLKVALCDFRQKLINSTTGAL